MKIEAQVGPQVATDGAITSPRMSKDGATVITELHGQYYEQNYRGGMFFGTSASGGIALVLPATGGGHPTLWNPAGSGFNASIVRLQLSYVSGNNAPGAVEWALTSAAGSSIGTGAPIVTFTNVSPTSAKIGGGAVSQMKWAPTTNSFVAAPVYLKPTGLSLNTMIGASTNTPYTNIIDYNGTLILTPGNALSLCFQTTTTTAVFQVALFWEEVII